MSKKKPKFTRELAEKIKDTILEHQEYFTPYVFEDVVVVGGVKKRGYSEHDIDIAILWNFDQSETRDLKQVDKIMDHLINWLKTIWGSLIDDLDIYCYIQYRQSDYRGKNVGPSGRPPTPEKFTPSRRLKNGR